MGGMMDMVMKMVMPLFRIVSDTLSDNSRAYLIDETDNCRSPPAEDKMFQKEQAQEVACGKVSDMDCLQKKSNSYLTNPTLGTDTFF